MECAWLEPATLSSGAWPGVERVTTAENRKRRNACSHAGFLHVEPAARIPLRPDSVKSGVLLAFDLANWTRERLRAQTAVVYPWGREGVEFMTDDPNEDVDDPWVEMWLLPWPTDRPEDRPPIKIGTWPLSLETEALADALSSIDEHDDTPRWQ
jgi:hypothetical protein